MKPGCTGCLTTVVVATLGILVLGALFGATWRILDSGDPADPAVSAVDGGRAQQKLFDLVRKPRRGETVTLSEPEVNALLTRHVVEARGVRLTGLRARLVGGDRLEVRAQTPVGQVLEEAHLGGLADLLPGAWRARPVALQVGARVRVEAGSPRQLRLEVDEFAMGRQRLPVPVLRLLVDPGTVGLLRWRLPEHIEQVHIEPGLVVIRIASSRS